ncbi:hypothetical protein EC900039_3840B, partial [Escherichia coli 90.0039]
SIPHIFKPQQKT